MSDNKNINHGDDYRSIPMTSTESGKMHQIRPDVCYLTNQIVNVIMIGDPEGRGWVLVDTGMPDSADDIIEAAEERFGNGTKPKCIILTHGHFDHAGNVAELAEKWNVPVYAHYAEFPYLTGELSYPEPDSSVEGGMLAKMSAVYPTEPVNITDVLHELPMDGTCPNLPEWHWFHVPGHTPGQIALFREKDRTLIAADAFVTVKQDSFYKVLIQKNEVHGPPVYLTTDWNAAKRSVIKLKDLKPQVAVTGHGKAMEGLELRKGLSKLVEQFDEVAVPDHGKFVLND